MEDLDFLNQEQNPAEATISNEVAEPAQQLESEAFVAPSWEDVKTGKINYKDLPPQIKSKVKQEAYEETPEDKKYLWDDYNYTPPETYHGIDKSGKKVDALDLDGFEELVRKGRIHKKTKIEQDVENLTHLVKEQNKVMLSQKESEVDRKILELKQNGILSNEDFDSYEKLLSDKQDVKFQKLQLEKKVEVAEPARQYAEVNSQYSLEEQVAVEVFGSKLENKLFIDLMARNKDMQQDFDNAAYSLRARNPNAPLDQIANAAKTIVESKFNLNKQQKPMFRNTVQSEQKTNLVSDKSPTKLSFNTLSERDKKWISSEARSGKQKYAGKSLDDIANIVYGSLLKK